MTPRNKIEFDFFLKMFGLFICGGVSIATVAAVWSYCPEAFPRWCAAINLVLNLVVIIGYIRKLAKEKNAAIEALQKKTNSKK